MSVSFHSTVSNNSERFFDENREYKSDKPNSKGLTERGLTTEFGGLKQLKYADYCLTGLTVHDTAIIHDPFQLIPIGNNNSSREGREMYVKSIHINIVAYPLISLVGGVGRVVQFRFIALWQNDVTNQSVEFKDLYTSGDFQALLKPEFEEQFNVLCDSVYCTGTVFQKELSRLTIDGSSAKINKTIPLNCATRFNDATTGSDRVISGRLLMYIITIGAANYYGHCRIRFTE